MNVPDHRKVGKLFDATISQLSSPGLITTLSYELRISTTDGAETNNTKLYSQGLKGRDN